MNRYSKAMLKAAGYMFGSAVLIKSVFYIMDHPETRWVGYVLVLILLFVFLTWLFLERY